MIAEEIKALKTGRNELRKFGLTVGGVFGALALLFYFRHKPAYILFAALSAPLVLLGMIFPRGLRIVYIGWMSMALVLGTVVSTILLSVFFYLVITPVGVLARLLGKDFLSLKLSPTAASYWMKRAATDAKTKAHYEQQF